MRVKQEKNKVKDRTLYKINLKECATQFESLAHPPATGQATGLEGSRADSTLRSFGLVLRNCKRTNDLLVVNNFGSPPPGTGKSSK